MRGGESVLSDSTMVPSAFEPLTFICSGASGPSRLTPWMAMVPNVVTIWL